LPDHDLNRLKEPFSRFRNRSYYPGQEKAIQFAMDSSRPIQVIYSPTGSGKSLIGMSLLEHFGGGTYLVSSKALQDQIEHWFPEARVMKGRSNYTCNLTKQTADLCLHSKTTPCPYKKYGCEYENHKKFVLAGKYRILNYSYFMAEANYVGRFSNNDIIVADEADLLEQIISSHTDLTIPAAAIRDLKLNPPYVKTSTSKKGTQPWQNWCRGYVIPTIDAHLRDIDDQLVGVSADNYTPEDLYWIKQKEKYAGLRAKMDIFMENVDQNWIFESKTNRWGESWKFSPVWTTLRLAEQYFWKHADRFVLMSGTFPPVAVLSQLLGLNPGDVDYLELMSTFPISSRPVYLDPVVAMSYKNKDDAHKVIDRAIEIIGSYPKSKILVHAVSYYLTSKLMETKNPRLMTHTGSDRAESLEIFKYSPNPLVLVSPSMERGVDLPDAQCDVIIWLKCPFLDLSDKLTSTRAYGSGIGGYWYKAVAAQTIVQGCGRGMRHERDHCITYCLDEQIYRMVVDYPGLFPKYFKEAVEIL
jgi:ATP-dependent DNA helicase DinG